MKKTKKTEKAKKTAKVKKSPKKVTAPYVSPKGDVTFLSLSLCPQYLPESR